MPGRKTTAKKKPAKRSPFTGRKADKHPTLPVTPRGGGAGEEQRQPLESPRGSDQDFRGWGCLPRTQGPRTGLHPRTATIIAHASQ